MRIIQECHFFPNSILRKSSCPLPPPADDDPVAVTLESLGRSFLNPSPALGFDGPSFLGANNVVPLV